MAYGSGHETCCVHRAVRADVTERKKKKKKKIYASVRDHDIRPLLRVSIVLDLTILEVLVVLAVLLVLHDLVDVLPLTRAPSRKDRPSSETSSGP